MAKTRKPLPQAPYVRARMLPASKEYVAQRVAANRVALAADPAHPGARFDGAYDWFLAAAAYAARRSYPVLSIGNAALARREQIVADAARMLQVRGCGIDELVPGWFRRSTRRAELRDAYRKAATPAAQLDAAHAWLLFASRRADRFAHRDGGAASARTAEIKDDTTASGEAAPTIGLNDDMDQELILTLTLAEAEKLGTLLLKLARQGRRTTVKAA